MRKEELEKIADKLEKLSDSVYYCEKKQSFLLFFNEENASGSEILTRLKDRNIKTSSWLRSLLVNDFQRNNVEVELVIIKKGAVLERGSFLYDAQKNASEFKSLDVIPPRILALLLEAMPREKIKKLLEGEWIIVIKKNITDFEGDVWPMTYYFMADKKNAFQIMKKGLFW